MSSPTAVNTPRGRLIHVRGDIYRKPTTWRGRPHNVYFVKVACSACGKPYYQDRSGHRRSKAAFCGGTCQYRSGPDHPAFKGKKRKRGRHGGAVLIYAPNHAEAKHGYVYEHRLVLEQKLGRLLAADELVHHIDMDPINNRPENLVVLPGCGKHAKTHASLNACVRRLFELGILTFDPGTATYRVKERAVQCT